MDVSFIASEENLKSFVPRKNSNKTFSWLVLGQALSSKDSISLFQLFIFYSLTINFIIQHDISALKQETSLKIIIIINRPNYLFFCCIIVSEKTEFLISVIDQYRLNNISVGL